MLSFTAVSASHQFSPFQSYGRWESPTNYCYKNNSPSTAGYQGRCLRRPFIKTRPNKIWAYIAFTKLKKWDGNHDANTSKNISNLWNEIATQQQKLEKSTFLLRLLSLMRTEVVRNAWDCIKLSLVTWNLANLDTNMIRKAQLWKCSTSTQNFTQHKLITWLIRQHQWKILPGIQQQERHSS